MEGGGWREEDVGRRVEGGGWREEDGGRKEEEWERRRKNAEDTHHT